MWTSKLLINTYNNDMLVELIKNKHKRVKRVDKLGIIRNLEKNVVASDMKDSHHHICDMYDFQQS